jgi:Tol biopolymer transport system component
MEKKQSTIVPGVRSADSPRVSPDGEWIAYLAGPALDRHVWILRTKGGRPRQLTAGRGARSYLHWRGKKRLTYAERISGQKQMTMEVNPFRRQASPRQIAVWGEGELTFGPAGSGLVAQVRRDRRGEARLSLHDAAGKPIGKVPRVKTSDGVVPRGCYHPSFAPDGRRFVYVRAGIQPDSDLYQFDCRTGKQVRLTSDKADNQFPEYSPDGRHIVFVAAPGGREHQLWLMNAGP